MHFELSETQRDFQRAMRIVCERDLAPHAEDVDRDRIVPIERMRTLSRVGFMGLMIPEEFAGNGGDVVSAIVGVEEIARVCPSTALVAGTTLLRFAVPLVWYGTQSQKARLLPRVAAGEMKGAWALTEPGGGSDTTHLQSRAARTSGGYLLAGEKAYVVNGPDAGALLVVATLGEDDLVETSRGAFVVEPPVEGMKVGEEVHPSGARGARVSGLLFRNCFLEGEIRLGGPEGPSGKLLGKLPHGSLLMAGYAVGVGQASIEAAIHYARERKTFGRPIASYQEIHFKIADMQVNVDVARLLALRAAWLLDAGRGSAVEASVAKLFASEMAPRCAGLCARIHGGRGVLEGSRAERLCRDSRLSEVVGGTSEMHRLFIAEEVLAGRA